VARANGVDVLHLGAAGPGLVVGYANLGEATIASAVDALAASVRAAAK
jgi:hypothetical protein